MRDNTQIQRAAAIDAMFAQICRAKPQEARELSLLLTPSERADMALFCYARTHTREQGRAIAGACTKDDLIRAGGHAGALLHDQAEGKGDTWGATVFAKKAVSLAG